MAWFPLPDVPSVLAYADERRLLERVDDLLAPPGGHADTGTGG